MSTMTEEIITEIAADIDVADLEAATKVRLGDLVRFGSAHTNQAVGAWGSGADACALSAAALAYEAMQRL